MASTALFRLLANCKCSNVHGKSWRDVRGKPIGPGLRMQWKASKTESLSDGGREWAMIPSITLTYKLAFKTFPMRNQCKLAFSLRNTSMATSKVPVSVRTTLFQPAMC